MAGTYQRVKAWVASTFEPLRPAYDAWMQVIAAFSWVLVRVILTIAFFTAFAIYGALLRLVRKDPMNRTVPTDEPTYWRDTVNSNDQLSDFRKQY